MPDRYAVIGNPIGHSKSPAIHAAFARQCGQDIRYDALLAPLDGFAATVGVFRREGGKGLNVTVPFKLEACALADRLAPRAEAAGAANTLLFQPDGSILADNTDGAGLVRDLVTNLETPISARRVLLLGAGGAARGVLRPLLEAAPAALVIANRTPQRAAALCAGFRPVAGASNLDACGFADLAGQQFDLVINATSASLADEAPPLPPGIYTAGALAYDMMYGAADTRFMLAARQAGAARLADGLGMLVEQAAESFLLWRGMRPDTAPVLAAMRRALRGQ